MTGRPRAPAYGPGRHRYTTKGLERLPILLQNGLPTYDDQGKALAAVNEWIVINLDPSHHKALVPYIERRERIVFVLERFAQSDAYKEGL